MKGAANEILAVVLLAGCLSVLVTPAYAFTTPYSIAITIGVVAGLATIAANVKDAANVPVPNVPISIVVVQSLPGGSSVFVGACTTDNTGTCNVTYVPTQTGVFNAIATLPSNTCTSTCSASQQFVAILTTVSTVVTVFTASSTTSTSIQIVTSSTTTTSSTSTVSTVFTSTTISQQRPQLPQRPRPLQRYRRF